MLTGAAFAACSGSHSVVAQGDTYSIAMGGVNTYINLSTPSNMNFDWDADSYSVMCWVYVASTANYQCVISKSYANSTHQGVFMGITNTGTPYLYLGNVSTSGGNVSASAWHLMGFTASGGVGKLYVDGVQLGSNISIGAETSIADWLIGASRYNNNDNTTESFPFNGLFHSVAVWSVALTGGQITTYYNSGTPISPSTYLPTGLIHWYRMGNATGDFATSDYRIADVVGTDHGTLTNHGSFGEGPLWLKSPGSSANSYSYMTTSLYTPRYQFRADDFVHQANWVSNYGSYTAVYSANSGDSVQGNSSFSGIKDVTVGDNFLMAAATEHSVSSSTAITYAFVYYTGALDGSGGFFAGSDDNATGKSHVRLFNYFYAKDIGARVYTDADADNEISGLNSVHANKYIMVHVTVDIPNATLKTFVNGVRVNSQAISGTFTAHALVGFGLMSVFKIGGSHYYSTATGQKFIEFTRYDSVLTPKQIAAQAAAWNTIKGYT